MTTSAQLRRLEALEAALGPTVSVEVRQQAERLATRLGITAEELLVDAAEIAMTCGGVPSEPIEAQAARLAGRLDIPVDELLADLERLDG